jgi:hypothetical protein
MNNCTERQKDKQKDRKTIKKDRKTTKKDTSWKYNEETIAQTDRQNQNIMIIQIRERKTDIHTERRKDNQERHFMEIQ